MRHFVQFSNMNFRTKINYVMGWVVQEFQKRSNKLCFVLQLCKRLLKPKILEKIYIRKLIPYVEILTSKREFTEQNCEMSIIASRHLYASLTFETRFQMNLKRKKTPNIYLPRPKIRKFGSQYKSTPYLKLFGKLSNAVTRFFGLSVFKKPIIELQVERHFTL